jgi:hypothetical protein
MEETSQASVLREGAIFLRGCKKLRKLQRMNQTSGRLEKDFRNKRDLLAASSCINPHIMAAQQSVKAQLLKIASQWPKDLIRPNHQFSEAVTQIANAHPAWSEASSTSATSSTEHKDGQAMADALSRLLRNRAIQQVSADLILDFMQRFLTTAQLVPLD